MARTTKKKDKADVSGMARILRCAAEALERLKAANKKRPDAKVTRARVEKKIVPKTLVEKDIVHRALTKTFTEKEIVKPSRAEPAYGLGLRHAVSQDAKQLQKPSQASLWSRTTLFCKARAAGYEPNCQATPGGT